MRRPIPERRGSEARLLTALVASFIIASCGQSNSSGSCPYHTTIVNLPGSPVSIAFCDIFPSDNEPQWIEDTTFSNAHSSVPLKAVAFQFIIRDAFDDVLTTQTVIQTGTFDMGVKQSGNWTIGDHWMPDRANFAKATCSVTKTIDASGTVWQDASYKPPAEASPTP